MPPGLGEFERIGRYFKPLAGNFEGALELSDDAGWIAPPAGHRVVVTTDAMVEGVHWLTGEDPARLGRKLLRVNLSDLAAMAAEPVAYTLTTALPPSMDDAWLGRLAEGLAADQQRFRVSLLGGDSVSTAGPAVLSVTAMGIVPAGQELRRSGGQPGDLLFVTGVVGDGALGLAAARGDLADIEPADVAALAERYRLPDPRVELALRLRGLAHAAIDLSDGLPGDAAHLCRASGLAARIEAARLPLSPAARGAIAERPDLLKVALAGGDDYELLFAAAPSAVPALADIADAVGVPIAEIGALSAGSGVTIVDEDGTPITGLAGWEHF